MTTASDRLGLPYSPKTPQVKGRVDEVKMARERGARVHPMSGAGRIKDDASNDAEVFEMKSVDTSHTLHGGSLLDLFTRAVRAGKEGIYVVRFNKAKIEATITLRRFRD